mgnify:CR=1 FL=1
MINGKAHAYPVIDIGRQIVTNIDIVENKGFRNLTYMPWYSHVKEFFVNHWKVLLLSFLGSFGVFFRHC